MFITKQTGVSPASELFINIGSQIAREFYYRAYEVGHYYLNEQYRFVRDDVQDKVFVALLVKGEIEFQTERGRMSMYPGDILITVPSAERARQLLSHKVPSSAELYWFFAGGGNTTDYSRFLVRNYATSDSFIVFRPENASQFLFPFCELFRLCKEDEYYKEQKTSKLLYNLLIDLGYAISVNKHHSLPMVDKALQYIENNYCSEISLDSIAEHLSLDKYYFSKVFKEHIGMSPYQYLISKRIQYAKYILSFTDYSIAQISEQVGYSDSSLFIRAFKKHTGVTPNQFRKQQKSKLPM